MNYQETIDFIHSRPRFKKLPTLKRTEMLLEYLGNPEKNGTFIHVAGTNGKGSTTSFLASLIHETGHSVGTFISPYIKSFNERISVNNIPISNDDIVELIDEMMPYIKKMDQSPAGGPTEFEVVTAMMFLYFKKHPVDVVIVEVGIGGTYDSTNVIMPVLSVITNVDLDHIELLGPTITDIAYQKAGIIKPQIPLVTGQDNQTEAGKVLNAVASEMKSKVKTLNYDFKIDENQKGLFEFKNSRYEFEQLESGLIGDYQKNNLAVALESFISFSELMHWSFDENQIKKALKQTKWPGRLEIINRNPTIVLDGAHNLPGVTALVESVRKQWPDQKIFILTAMLSDKLFNKMLDKLDSLAPSELILTSFNAPTNRNSVQENNLSQHVQREVHYEEDWKKALEKLQSQADRDDVIIITGSLYFISEVRSNLMN